MKFIDNTNNINEVKIKKGSSFMKHMIIVTGMLIFLKGQIRMKKSFI